MHYPNRYEIGQALEFAKRTFVDPFAQSRGIFITKATLQELAEHLSGFYYDHEDVEEIREAAYNRYDHSTLAGFIIKSESNEFDPGVLFDDLRGSGSLPEGMTLGPITSSESEGRRIIRSKLDYVKKRPGRIEFLQEDQRSFDFTMEEQGDGEWKVMIDCNSSTDSKVLEEVITRNTRKETRIEKLDQDKLTSSQTIRFFDELAKEGINIDQWSFVEVRQLVFRRGNNEEEEEVEESQLSGITQAILDGRNLRQNSFVKQSEEQGYRFTAMTYEYEHKTEPYVIEISAEFKGRPKVFEVSIKSYKSREGVDDEKHEATLSAKYKTQIRTKFWTKANVIFNQLLAEEKGVSL